MTLEPNPAALDEARGVALPGDCWPVSSIRIARSVSEIEEIREVWSSWEGHRDSDIDFYLAFIESSPETVRPHVIVIYRKERPDAMLIGRLEQVRIELKIGYLHLPEFQANCLTFVQGGLRGNASADNSRELVSSIMNSLHNREAEVAFLHFADVESAIHLAARTIPNVLSRDHLFQPSVHYRMALPKNAENALSHLSKNHRKDIRRMAKKLTDAGPVRTSCYRTPDDVARILADMEEVAQKTYQRGLGVGFSDTVQTRRMLHLCAEKGFLRAYFLYLDETPISYWVGTVCDSVFCSDYLAFDPRFGEYSPGTFLQTKVIEELCRSGVAQIDFGPGEALYKQRLATETSQTVSVYIYGPGLKALMINAGRTATGQLERFLRNALQRTWLYSRIKKSWRLQRTPKNDQEVA